jgi:hypothetical protein
MTAAARKDVFLQTSWKTPTNTGEPGTRAVLAWVETSSFVLTASICCSKEEALELLVPGELGATG